MRCDERTIRISVDDRGARYPVTIDPLASSPVWNVTSGQGASSFGASVASAGDVNGDGRDDVVTGGHNFDNGNQRAWADLDCDTCDAGGAYGIGKSTRAGRMLKSTPPVVGRGATLSLTAAIPNAPAFRFAGFAPASIPFDGGTLLVDPFTVLVGTSMPANGLWSLAPPDPQSADAHRSRRRIPGRVHRPGRTTELPPHRVWSGVHWTIGK